MPANRPGLLLPLPRVRARRGIALLLVLGVVAIASVLSWAMLAGTSVRNQVDASLADSMEAGFQADSGVSVALQYLRYPAQSPVALRQGTWNSFYGGQNGVAMWNNARGTTDVSVSNTGDGQFAITSKSTINGLTRTAVTQAEYTYDRYQITHAAAFNGTAFTMPITMTVNGPVVAKSGAAFLPTQVTNSPAVVPAGANVTPPIAELTPAVEAAIPSAKQKTGTERTYTYDGVAYSAEAAPATITGTLASTNSDNPLNVWYSDTNVTLNNATIAGTLIVKSGMRVTVNGTNVITPARPDMPALVVGGTLDMRSTAVPSRLTVNGVLWVGMTITDSASTLQRLSTGWLKVNGALLMGGTSPAVTNDLSPITVVYDATVKQVRNLSTVKTINGIAVRSWKSDTN